MKTLPWLVTAIAAVFQTGGPAPVLSEGVTIERAAAKGERHRYEAWLSAGDFFEVSV